MSTDPAPNLTKAVRTLELQELGVRLGEHEGALSISYPGGLTRYDNRFRAIEELNAADYKDVLVLARHHKGKADDAALRIDGEKFKSEQRLKREKAEKDLADRRKADAAADAAKAVLAGKIAQKADVERLISFAREISITRMYSMETVEGRALAMEVRKWTFELNDRIREAAGKL